MTEYGARSWTPMSRCDPLFADTDGMAEAKNTTTKSKPFYKNLAKFCTGSLIENNKTIALEILNEFPKNICKLSHWLSFQSFMAPIVYVLRFSSTEQAACPASLP